MTSVLEGVTILDMSGDIAGPYACMLMATMGARVIKIEPPGGSLERTDPRFPLWERGKESVALDLAQAGGRETARRLVARADLLVQSWLPAEAKALGLDYESLRLLNPRLIYCAVPPYPSATSDADTPGDHYTIAASSGMMANQGAPGNPDFVYAPLAAYGAAFTLCLAATSALYMREIGGTGQKVEVSLFHGAMAMQSAQFVSGSWAPAAGGSTRQGIRAGIPVYRLFKAQDGWFFLACGNNTFFNKLCILLDHPELAEDERYRDAPWGIPRIHHDALADILEPVFAANTVAHWVKLMVDNDIPCAPVQSREQYLQHPQLAVNQTIVPIEDPVLGPVLQMGVPLWMHGAPGDVPPPAPRPGEHTEHILQEPGLR
ncbi:MAG: CoA transferase [Chloroflexi bacterium]|nr:CoA transferase [Chloroflexota bacterium]